MGFFVFYFELVFAFVIVDVFRYRPGHCHLTKREAQYQFNYVQKIFIEFLDEISNFGNFSQKSLDVANLATW